MGLTYAVKRFMRDACAYCKSTAFLVTGAAAGGGFLVFHEESGEKWGGRGAYVPGFP